MIKKVAGAVPTYLFEAFDCLSHELLITKLEAYGFDKSPRIFAYDYLKNRMQRIKVNGSYSSWKELLWRTTRLQIGTIVLQHIH